MKEETLYDAASWNTLERVKELVVGGANIDEVRDFPINHSCKSAPGMHLFEPRIDGSTPIFIASYRDRADVLEYLATKGADVNKATTNGMTPLHAAAKMGNSEVVAALLDAGAHVKKPNAATGTDHVADADEDEDDEEDDTAAT